MIWVFIGTLLITLASGGCALVFLTVRNIMRMAVHRGILGDLVMIWIFIVVGSGILAVLEQLVIYGRA